VPGIKEMWRVSGKGGLTGASELLAKTVELSNAEHRRYHSRGNWASRNRSR
jgi:hypothetical protein